MSINTPRTLSCFIDESGDFGDYDSHCQYYIVSFVLHDQSISIDYQLNGIERYLTNLGFPHHAIHAGPLIRRESDYKDMLMEDRKKLFNLLFNFSRKIPIHFFCAKVKKSDCLSENTLELKLSKAIEKELLRTVEYWKSFDKIIIYYDNGQKALKRIISNTFNRLLPVVEYRKVQPADYRLFQVADLLCTLELTYTKIESGLLSSSEKDFFTGVQGFKKEYWRKIELLRL